MAPNRVNLFLFHYSWNGTAGGVYMAAAASVTVLLIYPNRQVAFPNYDTLREASSNTREVQSLRLTSAFCGVTEFDTFMRIQGQSVFVAVYLDQYIAL